MVDNVSSTQNNYGEDAVTAAYFPDAMGIMHRTSLIEVKSSLSIQHCDCCFSFGTVGASR